MSRSVKLFLEFILIAFIGLAVWYGIKLLNLFPNEVEISLNKENEEKIGDKMLQFMLSNEKQVMNPIIDSAVSEITQRLMLGLDSATYNYKFYVISNPEINAFTFLGGNIIIYTGLIDFADSPEEVAAVLAHELGHAELKHVTRKLVREIGLDVLLSVIGANDMGMIGGLTKQALSGSFSRDNEREADKFGIRLLRNCKIHPHYLADFFGRLEEEYGDTPDYLSALSTHPQTKERIENVKQAFVPSNFESKPFTLDWQRVKQNLN